MDLETLKEYITYSTDENGNNIVQIPRYIWDLFTASQNGEERRAQLRQLMKGWMSEPPLGDKAWWEAYEKTTERHRAQPQAQGLVLQGE